VRAFHLLWALPLAAIAEVAGFLLATIAVCGFSCIEPGPSPNYSGATTVLAVAGLIAFGALSVAPWHSSKRVRVVSSAAAVAVSNAIFIFVVTGAQGA
jgi:hypothetical protein